MMTQTATQKPIERILELFPDAKGPKGSDEWYSARCPAHQDRTASFSFRAIGDEHDQDGEGVVFKCFAGCERQAILEALHLDEKDLHYRSGTPTHSGSAKKTQRLTTFDLGVDKLIHPNLLLDYGLTDGDMLFTRKDGSAYRQKGVIIRYYDMAGQPYERYRLRTDRQAKEGSYWNRDSEAPLIPYGLEWLHKAQEQRQIVIVEGESDVWTLRRHGLPVLGIPGATNTQCLLSEHLTDIDQVYIIQEPDTAGAKFTIDIKARLDKIKYKGRVYAVNLQKECGAKDPNDLHKKDVNSFKATFETALLHGTALHKERPKPAIHRLVDLQDEVLPDTKWAIPDLLPEGLTLLVGKPKLGKSWMLLALLQAIASGGVALGNIPVEQGQTLYISLEDNKKRLQKRINTLLKGNRAANDFLYATKWVRLDEGGRDDLEQTLKDNPGLRLIGIDTWAKIKPRATRGGQKQQYDEDYDALTPLQELASKYGVAIVVVHHFRKMAGEDLIDQISGSTAMAGAVDNFLLLDRNRGETDAHLHAFGRDIEIDQDLIVTFDQDIASWKIKGSADDATVASTPVRQAILDVLAQHEDGLTFKELTAALGSNSESTTRNNVQPLRNEGKVLLKDNRVRLVRDSNASKTSKTSKTSKELEIEPDFTSDSYSVTSPVTSLSSAISDDINQPIEANHNGHNSHVTTFTSLTSHSPIITPDTIKRYPQEVREWHQAQGLTIKRVPCLRKHTSGQYLPWFNSDSQQWEDLCTECYPQLRMTKGRHCFPGDREKGQGK